MTKEKPEDRLIRRVTTFQDWFWGTLLILGAPVLLVTHQISPPICTYLMGAGCVALMLRRPLW
jgi:hypothetical protein